jgi:hypothetical protein
LTKELAAIGWFLVALALFLLLVVFVAVARAARVVAIRRPGGAVKCRLRLAGDTRWRHGFAAYRTDGLYWFSSYGVLLRPAAVFDRQTLRPVARHACDECSCLVEFDTGAPGETLWLTMHADALTGLLAWLEAGPQLPLPRPA